MYALQYDPSVEAANARRWERSFAAFGQAYNIRLCCVAASDIPADTDIRTTVWELSRYGEIVTLHHDGGGWVMNHPYKVVPPAKVKALGVVLGIARQFLKKLQTTE